MRIFRGAKAREARSILAQHPVPEARHRGSAICYNSICQQRHGAPEPQSRRRGGMRWSRSGRCPRPRGRPWDPLRHESRAAIHSLYCSAILPGLLKRWLAYTRKFAFSSTLCSKDIQQETRRPGPGLL
ncbi:hypothetical protein PsYK624_084440 [Phanerochaete sordida]|uniref:Uncharacterized protein n=1 Tax=Phanerochaete sordida TaxID=48140 RepID=A0A9P3LEI6_9APHY|nr:hypothetical protein PsYK624_084440 [Phanerochaete sordida]